MAEWNPKSGRPCPCLVGTPCDAWVYGDDELCYWCQRIHQRQHAAAKVVAEDG
jgi:hypothetical protein